MISLSSFRTLFFASAMTLLSPLGVADTTTCFDIEAQPFIRASMGFDCSCAGNDPVNIGLGVDLGKLAIRKDTSALGGGPKANCFATTILAESVAKITTGATATVESVLVKTTVILRTCNKSSCGSLLFGLVKWGGAQCVIEKILEGPAIQSWRATGPCECTPADPNS